MCFGALVHSAVVQERSAFRDVADLFEKISGPMQGTTVHLHGRSLTLTPSGTTAAPGWLQVAMWPQQLQRQSHASDAGAAAGRFSLGQGPHQHPNVAVASCAGSTIVAGELQLQPHSCIVLDSSCRDVELRDVVVRGASSTLLLAPCLRLYIYFFSYVNV
jgi:hypothetical protein